MNISGLQDHADNADLQAGAALHGSAVDRLHAEEQLQGARPPHALPHDGSAHLLLAVVSVMVARWQNFIPSCPWIAPGWKGWGRNPRKGRDQILQRSVAEP